MTNPKQLRLVKRITDNSGMLDFSDVVWTGSKTESFWWLDTPYGFGNTTYSFDKYKGWKTIKTFECLEDFVEYKPELLF